MTSLEPAAATIEEDIDFILSFGLEKGRQVLVYSKAEAIAIFKQANLLDCRTINAYPDGRRQSVQFTKHLSKVAILS